MDTNESDLIESTNDTEETVNEEVLNEEVLEESNDNQVEVDELKKQIASLEKQKKHWRVKASEPKEEKHDLSEIALLKKELSETQLIAKGYSDDEVTVISKVAGELGISITEAADKKYVQAEINELREERKVKDATPSASGRSSSVKRDVNYYIDKDIIPEDPEMVREMIAKKAGKTYKPLG